MTSKNCDCTISSTIPGCCQSENMASHSDQKENFMRESGQPYERPRNIERSKQSADNYLPSSDIKHEYSSDTGISSDPEIPSALAIKREKKKNMGKRQMMNDSEMMEKHRKSLRKFESLSIGGRTLTEMSIGGYDIDVTKAAMKAREVLPLPPSKLPIIFADSELNFYLHFFSAIQMRLGDDLFEYLIEENNQSDDDEIPLSDMIEEILYSSYDRSDDELTILLKKIITTTFELGEVIGRNRRPEHITVAANLWGFQYIEAGMRCEETTLHMWLRICYMYFTTSWFNAFKLAGVPSFALRSSSRRRDSLSPTVREKKFKRELSIIDEGEDNQLVVRSTARRSRSHKSSAGSTLGSNNRLDRTKQWMRTKS
jgi:hypothetical protein